MNTILFGPGICICDELELFSDRQCEKQREELWLFCEFCDPQLPNDASEAVAQPNQDLDDVLTRHERQSYRFEGNEHCTLDQVIGGESDVYRLSIVGPQGGW